MGEAILTNSPERGLEREKSLERELYFSDHYFSLQQLGSFAHQINLIWKMKPRSVLEVGIGNGFVSSFLKSAGIPVTTADINADLKPDIVAPLHELRRHLKEKHDVVVCCEVLEHMPLSDLDQNLDYLKEAGDRLFLTLPNSFRSWGIGGILNLPKLGAREVGLNIDFPLRRPIAGGPHFWEVGYSSQCSRKAIEARLAQRFGAVKSQKFSLNPYHVAFVCG